MRLLLEGADSGLQSAVQKAMAVYDFVEAVGEDQRFDYRLQLRQADGQVELALVRDGTPGELVSGKDAAALLSLRPQRAFSQPVPAGWVDPGREDITDWDKRGDALPDPG